MLPQIGTHAAGARAHEELFAYWASRREGARLPCRANIHPAHFKRHLPTVSLIDVLPEPQDYRLRLAGTGLYGVYGREITGKTLDEIYNSAAADYWRGAAHLSILWLRLPLASNGTDVDMILGYDGVVGQQAEGGTSGIRAA